MIERTPTGRFTRTEPEMQRLRPDPSSRALRPRMPINIIELDFSGLDFSGLEVRVLATLAEKEAAHARLLSRMSKEPLWTLPS